MNKKDIERKEFIKNYSEKIARYNQLIDYYNNKLSLCLADLRNIISTQYYYDYDDEKQLKEEQEIILSYLKNRQAFEKINDKIDRVSYEISIKESSLNEKQLKKIKHAFPIKKKTSLDTVLSNLDNENGKKEIEGYVGDDEEGYFDISVTRDYIGIAINRNLMMQIKVEFNLNTNGTSFGSVPKKIYDGQDSLNEIKLEK